MIVDASNIKLHAKNDGVGSFSKIATLKEASVAFNTQFRETTRFATGGYQAFVPTVKNFEMSGNTLIVIENGYSADDLFDAWENNQLLNILFEYHAGNKLRRFSGNAYIQSLNLGGSTGQDMSCSIQLKGTGAAVKASINL